MVDKASLDRLQKKRVQMFEAREHDRLRAEYGKNLAAAIGRATGRDLSLDEFDIKSETRPIEWTGDIRNAPGLVAAYINKSEACSLLTCIRSRISLLSGEIGFHEKKYLGFAKLSDVNPMNLLSIAELTEESVIFCNDSPAGIVMVDCYPNPPSNPFSILVQGDELSYELAPCFEKPFVRGFKEDGGN